MDVTAVAIRKAGVWVIEKLNPLMGVVFLRLTSRGLFSLPTSPLPFPIYSSFTGGTVLVGVSVGTAGGVSVGVSVSTTGGVSVGLNSYAKGEDTSRVYVRKDGDETVFILYKSTFDMLARKLEDLVPETQP